ncbi:MAG: hypothetical protein J6P72_00465 [Firmicutes bacterium]|nr:hypothetical protein [Bacillota bacterium]
MSEPKKNTARKKAPKGKIVKRTRFSANPYPFAFTMVSSPVSGESIYKRVVSPQVPDSILQTGNKKVLEKFYYDHYTTLTAADRRYMLARIHTAQLVDRLERNALQDIAEGKVKPLPQARLKKGYMGFDKLKLNGPQTSSCGCWSCGLSLLLKNRGVDISQEEIRAYKPEYAPGEEGMGREQMLTSNRDTYFSPYDAGDLVLKVLPNSSLVNISFNPIDEEMQVLGGIVVPEPPARLSERKKERWRAQKLQEIQATRTQKAKEAFKASTKALFISKIKEALNTDHSALIMNQRNGHFITITGISSDDKKIRVEDSRADGQATTRYLKIDDIINKCMEPGMKGMDLTWIRDLPAPTKENLQEGQNLSANIPNSIKTGAGGEVILNENVQGQYLTAQTDPKPGIGMIQGQELSNTIYVNQDQAFKNALYGGYLAGYGFGPGADGNEVPLQMQATENIYLPKKLRLYNDPDIRLELQQKAIEEIDEQEQQKNEVQLDQDQEIPNYRIIDENGIKEEPGAGTYDAYEANYKHQLLVAGPDTELYIANLYALNVVKNSQEKREEDQISDQKAQSANALVDELEQLLRPQQPGENHPDAGQGAENAPAAREQRIREIHQSLKSSYPHLAEAQYKKAGSDLLKLTPEQLRTHIRDANRTEKARISPAMQRTIEELAKRAIPLVKDMLHEKTGSIDLPFTALNENQRELVTKVDAYARDKYYLKPDPQTHAADPDWVTRRQVIGSTLDALTANGTGRNYLGFTRGRNSDAYTNFHDALTEYKTMLDQGVTPSGMQNRYLIQKGLDYVKDRMKVRSTKGTGQLRFDSTMRVLQQLMPERRFQRLLNQINREREANTGDKNHVDKYTYAPKTVDVFSRQKVDEAVTKSGSAFVKLCSEALAAQLIGMESQRGNKTLVMDPYDPAASQILEQRARQLRHDPDFRAALRGIQPGLTEEQTVLNRRIALEADGKGLVNLYNNQKAIALQYE